MSTQGVLQLLDVICGRSQDVQLSQRGVRYMAGRDKMLEALHGVIDLLSPALLDLAMGRLARGLAPLCARRPLGLGGVS